MKTFLLLLLSTSVMAQEPQPAKATPTPAAPVIGGLSLYQGATRIAALDGAKAVAGTSYKVQVDSAANTGSVRFARDGSVVSTKSSPFVISWAPTAVGQHSWVVTSFSGINGSGKIGNVLAASVQVVSASPSPSATPSPSLTPTPSPTTPPPTPTPSATPTSTPSPSPSPSLAYVTVTVQWMATKDDRCTILYGEADPPDTQADGGIAVRDGSMTVTISGLKPNTTYYFSDIITKPTGIESPPLSPSYQYQTSATPNQLFRLGNFQLKKK